MSRCSKSWRDEIALRLLRTRAGRNCRHGVRAVEAMTPQEPDRPLGPRTTGGQDAAVVFATGVGKVILPKGRGSFALCVAFAGVCCRTRESDRFEPGADSKMLWWPGHRPTDSFGVTIQGRTRGYDGQQRGAVPARRRVAGPGLFAASFGRWPWPWREPLDVAILAGVFFLGLLGLPDGVFLLVRGIRPPRVRGGVPPVPGGWALAPPAFEKPHPELSRRQRSGRES